MRNAWAVCNGMDFTRIHRLLGRIVFAPVGAVSAAFHVGFVEWGALSHPGVPVACAPVLGESESLLIPA